MTAPSTLQWFKSSYSGGSGTECVECAHAIGDVLLRDSKTPRGPVVAVCGSAWHAFTWAVRRGELED
ncbi:DUF397 domain-containing protein [Streptomyces sp. NPDC001984]|uniref:DUF397 domain-containing protein n=1 Tax=Streptomyces sp. NPDC002619 TaxID=3364655 RepID=UPI0036AD180F